MAEDTSHDPELAAFRFPQVDAGSRVVVTNVDNNKLRSEKFVDYSLAVRTKGESSD